jgi:meiotically up-regulated gene 157 (Mug157) protein
VRGGPVDAEDWNLTSGAGGIGNPVNGGTGLIKSAFRASDDATILPFHIPSNAFVSVELRRVAALITSVDGGLADECQRLGASVESAIYKHGVHQHPVYGSVFAYEVDGYGSRIYMDDASPPSLLSLPYLGFVSRDDPVYVNTRRMVLSKEGNPYYRVGSALEGQGSPHIDLLTMWPVGTIAQALTTDAGDEIKWCLETLKKSSAGLGLVHEGGMCCLSRCLFCLDASLLLMTN